MRKPLIAVVAAGLFFASQVSCSTISGYFVTQKPSAASKSIADKSAVNDNPDNTNNPATNNATDIKTVESINHQATLDKAEDNSSLPITATSLLDDNSNEVNEICDNDECVNESTNEVVENDTNSNAHRFIYTDDISDTELAQYFVDSLEDLGSISVGFPGEGRVINSMQLLSGDGFYVVAPDFAWGTKETIEYIKIVGHDLVAKFGELGKLRVNHIGKKDGGYIRPHRSHQSGRDVDIGLYYQGGQRPEGSRKYWLKKIDPALNWQLVHTLITNTDVQLILVDRAIQKVLINYALQQGVDRAWLDSIFSGPNPIIKHARRHRDHFHVRFYNARAQELGYRVQPLLASRPDENKLIYKVRSGDTLSTIARKYNSTVRMIQNANGMRSTFLRVARVLVVPMRGPCTKCPLPSTIVLPARRLPPVEENKPADGQNAKEPSDKKAPDSSETPKTPDPNITQLTPPVALNFIFQH
ncbi:MAG: penicillin-insensitive murein endopeptidase [Deltaproteobacteria bacterium]|nr:penicillin-insensitive murein endopeptidase [Deltaproteobacteria bacterium]